MRIVFTIVVTLLAATLVGCDDNRSGTGAGSAGGGQGGAVPPIFAPYQGDWQFSLPKTIAKWQADGASPAEIAAAQKQASVYPLHPDMSIAGTTATLTGLPMTGSYDFFALHPHQNFVCGKAWHHEDRNDPGDMDKYLVRLEMKGADLHLSVRVPEDAADPADPDITVMPITAGSAATCTADAAPNPPWDPWRTLIFEPKNRRDR